MSVTIEERTAPREMKEKTPGALKAGPATYVPSRYNVKVQDENGQWIVYNSLSGSVGAIPKDKESALLSLLKDGVSGAASSDSAELARRGFLVLKGVDETRRVELLKQKRQGAKGLHLILMPTEECNFRCVYCYESFARGAMKPRVRQGVKNLVSRLAPKMEFLSVSWFGGEPLSEWGIIEEISSHLMDSCQKHGVSYSANMTSNGYYLDAETFRKMLACGVKTFQITLDGCPEQHDAMRVLKGGGATFERIWNNLKAARRVQEPFNVKIRVNFNKQTLERLIPFLSLLRSEFKGDERFSIFFRPVGHWGGSNDENVDICDKKMGETASFDSARLAIRQGIPSDMAYPFMRPGGSVCYAANPYSFVIGSDGTIYKCTVALNDENNQVGRILQNGEMELDQDRFGLWTTSDDSRDSVCQSCFFRAPCQGAACPLVRIKSGARPCPPEKQMVKRALLTVWDNFKTFGKLGSLGEPSSRD